MAQPSTAAPAIAAGFLQRADAVLGRAIALVAATILLVEVFLLLANVLARYLFNRPLVWGDELASILFLWLCVFGAVLAMRRNEHMRLTALVGRMPPHIRAPCDVIGLTVVSAFLLIIVYPAWEYAYDESWVRTPAMEISNTWRAAAVFAGAVLLALSAALRFVLLPVSGRLVMSVVAAACVIAGAMYLTRPMFLSFGNYNLLIFFVLGIIATVFIGVPIAFAFGVMTVAYIAVATHAPMTIVISRMDEGMSHLILLSIPLFIFLGLLIEMTGMARAMVNFLAALLGHVRGGLSYVLLGAMILVSGISGAKAADMAAVGPVLFPEMKKRGARPGELVSLLAASGAMAETIPPSLVLITIGSVANVSIAGLFTGGLLPALVAALALVVVCSFRARGEDLSGVKRASLRQV